MGLRAQVRERTSPIATNCAAAVTIAAGALQPVFGCRISRSLHSNTALHARAPNGKAHSLTAPHHAERELHLHAAQTMPIISSPHTSMTRPLNIPSGS